MTTQETEEKIRAAFTYAAPDELESILSMCTPQRNGTRHFVPEQRGRTFAQVILDVNPSVLLQVEEEDTIHHAQALNADGEKILEGLTLDGTSLDEAMDTLVSVMVDNGYLSEMQNSVLVSVADEDQEKQSALQDRVSQMIAEAVQADLADTGVGASVISQSVDTEDEELVRLADTFGISLGKAALIKRMMEEAKMDEKDQEKMANMSVNDMAILADEEPIKDKNVKKIGRASDKAYIGHKGALKAALAYAGITMKDVHKQKVKMGCKHGLMIYKVKIKGRGGKYKYYLDARTGEMVRCKKNGKGKKKYYKKYKKYGKYGKYGKHGKKYWKYSQTYVGGGTNMEIINNQPNETNIPMPEGAITEQQAKEAALSHAGLKESDCAYVYAHPEIDHGRVEHYDVKFVSGGMKYKYAIGLYDGAVLGRAVKDKVHKGGYVYEGNYHEHMGGPMDANPDAAPAAAADYAADPISGDMIGEDEALEIALGHAGLTMSNLIRWKIKLRTKHGRTVYRIKLKVPGYEYEIDVDAYSKAVTKAHKEIDY